MHGVFAPPWGQLQQKVQIRPNRMKLRLYLYKICMHKALVFLRYATGYI